MEKMNRPLKKVIGLFAASALFLTTLSAPVFAEDPSETGGRGTGGFYFDQRFYGTASASHAGSGLCGDSSGGISGAPCKRVCTVFLKELESGYTIMEAALNAIKDLKNQTGADEGFNLLVEGETNQILSFPR